MQENAKIWALDRLLLERFGGKGGRGLALDLARRPYAFLLQMRY
jgi:hypothetical protein